MNNQARAYLGLFLMAWSLWWVALDMYQVAYLAAMFASVILAWLWDGKP